MTITAEELKELRDQQSGIIGMMMATTNARSGKMTLIESQMLRLLDFVNRVPNVLDELQALDDRNADLDRESQRLSDQIGSCNRNRVEWISRAEKAEAELAALAAQKPVAYRWEGEATGRICYDGVKPLRVASQELFTRASPAGVVVPEVIEPTIEAIRKVVPTANPDEYACCVGADMWNACRAAVIEANKVGG